MSAAAAAATPNSGVPLSPGFAPPLVPRSQPGLSPNNSASTNTSSSTSTTSSSSTGINGNNSGGSLASPTYSSGALATSQVAAAPDGGGGVGVGGGAGGEVLMQGWLEKKGSKRWFLLTASQLSWCAQPTPLELIGHLPLARLRFENGPKKLQFTLTTPQKSYVLTAKTDDEHGRWNQTMRKAIELANAAQQVALLDAVHQLHRKQGPLRHNGTKAWVVLDDTRLLRFATPKDAKERKAPKWTLDLCGCKVMEHAHGKAFFYIVALHLKTQEKHEFACETVDDTLEWVTVVTGAIAKANAAGPKVVTDVRVGSGVAIGSSDFDAAMPFNVYGDLPTDDVDGGGGGGGGGGGDDGADLAVDMAELYKDGFLEKKGSTRWFLFSGEKLSWALKPTTSDFIGTIQLSVTEVEAGPKPTQFTLKTPAKTYVLTAKTTAEAKSWCEMLIKGRNRGGERRRSAVKAHAATTVLLFEGSLSLKKQKRFFRLQNETLSCYASEDECKTVGLPANKGMWDLFGCTCVEEVHAQPLIYLDSEQGGFTLELAADSKAEALAWATRIEAGIERANKRGALKDDKLSKADRKKALEQQEEKDAKLREKAAEEERKNRQLAQVSKVLKQHKPALQAALCGVGVHDDATAGTVAAAHKNDAPLDARIDANGHCVLLALGNAYQNDELVRAIVRICFANRSHATFVDQVMLQEIDRCTVDTTLFRTDSLATKTAGAYLKMVARDYLIATVGPTVRDVIAAPDGYEVDPSKLSGGGGADDVAANMARLAATCGVALERITESLPDVPPVVRIFFERLKRRVERKFPSARLKAIGAFMFLRFMQPSIFSPEGFGVLDSPPPAAARRALILVAKVLQNLANGVKFGNKEAFMADMNAFVMANVEELFYFLDEISATHNQSQFAYLQQDGAAPDSFDAAAVEDAWTTVLGQLLLQRERVEQELQKADRLNAPEWLVVKQILDSVK